jgi:hypothetical protein
VLRTSQNSSASTTALVLRMRKSSSHENNARIVPIAQVASSCES